MPRGFKLTSETPKYDDLLEPKTINERMDIANRWADGEESLRNERPRSPKDNAFDGGDPFDSGRRSGTDQRKKAQALRL